MSTDFTPDEAEEQLGSRLDDAVPTHGYRSVPVVCIAASDAALPQVQQLLQGVPRDSGLAFVVMRRDAPGSDGEWPLQLGQATALRVMPVENSVRLERDTVYVLPPARGARALDGALLLTDREPEHGRMVIDLFLRSLADSHGAHSAAVVLSGSGGDGAIGIKRIKERGGLTVAQDPHESAQDAMPRAAIATGMVDWVLPARDMPQRLLAYFSLEPRLKLPREDGPQLAEVARAAPDEEAPLRDILVLLRARTGRDFAHYKRATILRRIGRRMQVNGVETLPLYLECLRTRPGEPAALLQDLLITVTNFFRDAACFAALQAQLPELFRDKGPDDTVRVWVAACATGEEAYSIAILLAEHARTLQAPPMVQVFATDLDEEAIAMAREGVYPEAVEADVSEERLRRHFVKEHRGYRVRRELRETVLFAAHDLLKDSPFSRLDLVSCRNLLIYLTRDAQRRVFDTFHFALLPHGRLFLGASEGVEDGSPLFHTIDKKHRIYGRRATPRTALPLPAAPASLVEALEPPQDLAAAGLADRAFASAHAGRGRAAGEERMPSWGELHLRLLEHLAPPSILVDGESDIVHLSPGAGRYLQIGGGEPTRNLLRAVPTPLRIELRSALYQAAQTRSAVEAPPVRVDLPGMAPVSVAIRVTPAADIGDDLFLVMLREDATQGAAPSAATAAAVDPVAQHLDREIERLKAHLRDTVEQYEASNEELKASNEELQAMNEELRSASEELETSREELQSINEELSTVNHEMKLKMEELGQANSDLQNLMDATAIATVFLDRALRITRYTPSAVSLFNLIPTDVGRPLTDLTTHLRYPGLDADARRVLERLVPVEREVGQADGSWYLARLLPYRTVDDRIAGVVLAFVDISARKQAEEARLWLSAVVTASSDAIISFSLDHTILSWNAGAERIFGFAAEEAIGRPLSLIAPLGSPGQPAVGWTGATQPVENLEAVRTRKDGSEVHVALTISPIRDRNGQIIAGTAIARDISPRKRIDTGG